jgi:phosphinothricin acetyltransferase
LGPPGAPTIPEVHTRPVEAADAEALMAIYNIEVLETTVTFDVNPRDLAEQLEWIADHRGVHSALVAVDPERGDGPRGARGESIAGFASMSHYRMRAAYATTVESSVYVERSARGRGVGRLLLEDLIEAAKGAGFHSMIARIVGENAASIRLHEVCAFEMVGVEREVGRKHGRWLDVVELQRLLA